MTEQSTTDAIAYALLTGGIEVGGRRPIAVDAVDWTPAGLSWWADTVARLAGTRCDHVTDPDTVVTGQAWGLGLRCTDCPMPDPDDAAPSCDRCGLTPLAEDGTWGGCVPRGRVVLAVILCMSCFGVIGGESGEGPS